MTCISTVALQHIYDSVERSENVAEVYEERFSI